ncbi:MAG: hypothetical protein RIC80_10880 [Cyclobacteriaceae bacterium]
MNNDQKLEEFIKNHRGELESSPAEDKLWQAIQVGLDQGTDQEAEPDRKADYNIYWKVAAILLLALSSVLGYYNWQSSESDSALSNPEFANAETYYNELINQKKEEIRVYAVSNPELESSFLEDISALDQMYAELKKEAKKTGGQEIVLDAMIQNLQLRIDILNQQIIVLEQIKNREENANATI